MQSRVARLLLIDRSIVKEIVLPEDVLHPIEALRWRGRVFVWRGRGPASEPHIESVFVEAFTIEVE